MKKTTLLMPDVEAKALIAMLVHPKWVESVEDVCEHLWEQHWPCLLETADIACAKAQCRHCGVER